MRSAGATLRPHKDGTGMLKIAKTRSASAPLVQGIVFALFEASAAALRHDRAARPDRHHRRRFSSRGYAAAPWRTNHS